MRSFCCRHQCKQFHAILAFELFPFPYSSLKPGAHAPWNCGAQLLLSSGRQSIIPGLSGLLAGLTYRSNICGIRRLKVRCYHCATPGAPVYSAPYMPLVSLSGDVGAAGI
jgi:hypothetical protein